MFEVSNHYVAILPSISVLPLFSQNFQEVMQDPHVAADGITYEAEAIRAWLDSEHDTSPMTNVKLSIPV